MKKIMFSDRFGFTQPIFCVCGKLATGLHEANCRRFNKMVDKETCKRLEYLLK